VKENWDYLPEISIQLLILPIAVLSSFVSACFIYSIFFIFKLFLLIPAASAPLSFLYKSKNIGNKTLVLASNLWKTR
jgi:hypothetical protein